MLSILFILPAFFSGCITIPDHAGTSEQGNARVVAIACRSDGQPASGATVRIRPAGYVTKVSVNNRPKSSIDLKTDSLGSVTIDSLPTGSYSIEITDEFKEAFLLKCDISETGSEQIITVTDTLQPFASLKGKVDFNSNNNSHFIQVEGLERLVAVDSSGNYCLSDLPYGTYTIRIVSIDSTITPAIIKDIVVDQGRVTLAPYTGWIFSKNVFLNTTLSGTDINENVNNFPVLIRLSESNFNFDEAKGNGDDFRIFRSETDTSSIPFAIENWDSVGGSAEIWVKIDTIYANCIRHYFTLKWGNPAAQSVNSDGAAVFDTASGFKGVWHLGKPVDAIVKDQTSNSFNGIATATATVPGIIGMAQSFNGESSEISISGPAIDHLNFDENSTFTVSAWVRIDTIDSLFHGIVFKSNFQYGLQLRPANQWEFMHFKDKSGWEMSRATAETGSWQHLTGVCNGTKQFLYVNGICVDSSILSVPNNTTLATDQPLEIGHCPDGGKDPDRFFKGTIDEVRVAGIAYSAEWIKLVYLNQKEADELIKW